MDYLDFEIEIGIGTGRIYPVTVLRSAAGEARENMIFPFDELALENQLLVLQNALLRSGGKYRTLLPEEVTVQKFGQVLFNALFNGEIGKRYAVSQLSASSQGHGLRLKLRILSPELAALPWEFLYDANGSEYMCLSSATPIVRYLELAQPPRPLPVTPPLSILGIISSPKDLPELDIEREKQRLEKAIKGLRANGLVELTWMSGRTWYDLQRVMRKGPWHILHFIGHGGFDTRTEEGLIALENEEGKAHLLSATQLGRLLADHRSLRLLVLNSCEGARGSKHNIFSSTATILVRCGIPAVLAMQYAITDRAAIELARSFYEALADGLPVDTAVNEARKAISLGITNTLEWGTPVLYMRSSNGILFEMKQPSPNSYTLANRPAIKQQPSQYPLVHTEVPQLDPIQDKANSSASNELLEQDKQSVDETFSTTQANKQTDLPTPLELEAPSPDMEQCPACGVKLLPGGAFCSSCGHRLMQVIHVPQMVFSAEEHVPLSTTENFSEHKTDTTVPEKLEPQEEPLTISSIPVTNVGKFTLVDTLATDSLGYSNQILSVAISPDGQTLVSGSNNTTVKLWNLQKREIVHTFSGHRYAVFSVAISPDGHTLVSGSSDQTIKVWNLQNGKIVHTLSDHVNWVLSVAISPDGHTLVSGSKDQTIKVWNLQNGELIRTLSNHMGAVLSVAISPDGQILASGSDDKTIKLWNLQNGELMRTLEDHTDVVNCVAISPDGQTLVSSSDKTIGVWNLQNGEFVHPLEGHTALVRSVVISPDGQILVSSSRDKTIKMWNLQNGDCVRTLEGHTGTIFSVAISPDGQTLVSGSSDQSIKVWGTK
jgi:WD40 repeat protein